MAIVYDLDGVEHDKHPVDVRECIEHLGWTSQRLEPVIDADQAPEPVSKRGKRNE